MHTNLISFNVYLVWLAPILAELMLVILSTSSCVHKNTNAKFNVTCNVDPYRKFFAMVNANDYRVFVDSN
jgi:hypothetical protein